MHTFQFSKEIWAIILKALRTKRPFYKQSLRNFDFNGYNFDSPEYREALERLVMTEAAIIDIESYLGKANE